jgi:hypothetical protein
MTNSIQAAAMQRCPTLPERQLQSDDQQRPRLFTGQANVVAYFFIAKASAATPR